VPISRYLERDAHGNERLRDLGLVLKTPLPDLPVSFIEMPHTNQGMITITNPSLHPQHEFQAGDGFGGQGAAADPMGAGTDFTTGLCEVGNGYGGEGGDGIGGGVGRGIGGMSESGEVSMKWYPDHQHQAFNIPTQPQSHRPQQNSSAYYSATSSHHRYAPRGPMKRYARSEGRDRGRSADDEERKDIWPRVVSSGGGGDGASSRS